MGGGVMSHWGNVLKEARIRAGLTQEELAEKVPISVSYIRKMETGLLGPPRRNKAEMLADALSITDVEERNAFFRAAEVGNDEDMQGFKLVKVEEDEAEQGEQARGTATYNVGHPSVKQPARVVGARAEEIEQLIASGGYSEEEEKEVWGALIEMVKRFNSLKEMQRKVRKED
jgi:transcriptional regulator with XRE-family HTH domain